MSIIALNKVTFYGHVDDRKQVITDLQEFGCLHLISLAPEKETLKQVGPSSRAREALRYIRDCPNRRRQVSNLAKFDAVAVERQILDIKDRIQDLEDESDFLIGRIASLRPWGDFQFPPLDELANLRFWFYAVPHKDMGAFENSDYLRQIITRDNRFNYVVIIAEDEPEETPVARVQTGNKSLTELEERLEEVELALEDLQAERAGLTRWCLLLSRSIDRLEDQAAVADAVQKTYTETQLFALQAWTPVDGIAGLKKYAQDKGLVLVVKAPEPEETPPTMMVNPAGLAGGQDLVSFYTTPKYWLWDPSTIVFFSFALFFAMICADAGYSVTLGLFLAVLWKRLGASDGGRRFRIVLASLVGVGLVYGVMVGSYFGLSPAEGSIPSKLKVLDMMDFNLMMHLSILLGVFHLVLANAVTAWHFRRSARAAVPAAWVFVFLGATTLWQANAHGQDVAWLIPYGAGGMAIGLIGIVLFSATEGSLGQRLLKGLAGLTGLSSAFGDALSYLRLFALGLASASLASTFNSMAGQVKAALPGIGILFALLIVLFGHTLNFVLSLASGFIHGLRLNFIEFFRWSISEEGYPFKPFERKER
ncbi:MAG: V-type ATPase 116kDa subunit family protein [Desulfobacterales bacterium]|nr:V-type ATPase 116kDa subunit family protein [Desulfobacterales bacterium]